MYAPKGAFFMKGVKNMNFLEDTAKVEKVIYWTGFLVIGWLLKLLGWVAQKTKWIWDDKIVEEAKNAFEKAKKWRGKICCRGYVK